VANFLGASLEFLALLPLLVLMGVDLTAYALFLPAIVVAEFLLVFGLSLSLSSLNLKYRDFYQLWDIALQLGFFLSPIVYDPNLIPIRYRFLYSLNPVTCLIESAREVLLQHRLPSTFDSVVIVSTLGILAVVGFVIFRRLEGGFAEEL
jgi:ABC-type polysaccharide/polyol phosphate export permease